MWASAESRKQMDVETGDADESGNWRLG